MIKNINKAINNVNRKIGVSLKIPLPTKNEIITNRNLNAGISITSLSLGILKDSKFLMGIGLLSSLSALMLHYEKNKFK